MLTLIAGVLTAVPASAAAQPRIMAWWTGRDNIIGEGWAVGSSVTLTADDPSTVLDPDWTQTVVAKEGRNFDVIAGIDVRPGFEITAGDGTVLKSLVIEPVIVTSIDLDADTVSGLVRPLSGVMSGVFGAQGGDLGMASTTADALGRWTVDLSVPRDQPSGGDAIDIQPGNMVNAGVGDADKDWTYWQGTTDGVLNVVQAIPDSRVDVCLDGIKALVEVDPGETVSSIPFDSFPPSNLVDLAVVHSGEPCTGIPMAEVTGVSLRGAVTARNVTAVAFRDAAGESRLETFTNNMRPTAADVSRLALRQVTDVPALDLWIDAQVVSQSLAPGTFFKSKPTAGVHAMWLSAPGDYVPLVGPVIVKLSSGVAYQFHAWGDSEGGFEFAVIDQLVGTR
jgi:hypothetical protein